MAPPEMAAAGQEAAEAAISSDSDIGLEPEVVVKKHKNSVKRGLTRYRMLKRYHNMDWYFKAQVAKEKRLVELKRDRFEQLCVTAKRVLSDYNKRSDAKKDAEIKELFEEYTSLKNKVQETRAELKNKKEQTTFTQASVLSKSKRKTVSESGPCPTMTIAKYENELKEANRQKNAILSKVGNLRREIARMMSQRLNYMKSVELCLSNLAQGKKYMLDILQQAVLALKTRGLAMESVQRIIEKRKQNREEVREILEYLKKVYDREGVKAMFFTQKGMRRIIKGSKGGDVSPEVLDSMEKELREKFDVMYQHYIPVASIFWTKALNPVEVGNIYQECTQEYVHIMTYMLAKATKTEKENFLANQMKRKIANEGRKFVLNAKKNKDSLTALQGELAQLENKLNMARADESYKSFLKEYYLERISDMFANTDLNFILRIYPNWRKNVDIFGHAMMRVEKIIQKAILVYKKMNQRLYESPFIYNKFGQHVVVIPKDPRKRARALAEIAKRKHMIDADTVPTDTPCPLCLEEERMAEFRQKEDKVRTLKYFQDQIELTWPSEAMKFFVHRIELCGHPGARELQQG
uniref:Golgin subfamily A member 4 n=1 Tax=Lygus hesperus TaxID=30085 RepID=A0A0A9YVL7_LYGHE